MEQTIDTHLFIDIILSEGVMLLREITIEDDIIGYYHGINGRKVQICTSDEFITHMTAKAHLIQLGLASLIDRGLFN